MAIHPRAGQSAQASDLVDIPKLVSAYYVNLPDVEIREQQVAFGTSGHRGSSLRRRLHANAGYFTCYFTIQ